MKNIYISYLASLLCFLLVSCRASVDSRDRYVVVLSMDGFRSDYPSRAHTPTLDSLANVGASMNDLHPRVSGRNHTR